MGSSLLIRYPAAKRYQQGFHFVNCGADIVALTSSMSAEVQRVKALTSEDTGTGTNNGCSVIGVKNTNGTENRSEDVKLY